MAWAMHELRSLAETLEACESKPYLKDSVDRIHRLVKSAADVMIADLGEDYEPVRNIVETYAHVGDRDPNWLLNVDHLAEQGSLEKEGLNRGKQSAENGRV
jgi:hypothetical protein